MYINKIGATEILQREKITLKWLQKERKQVTKARQCSRYECRQHTKRKRWPAAARSPRGRKTLISIGMISNDRNCET